MAEKALKQPEIFIWTGTDKRGVRVKGQTRGSNPTLIKADLRKQGIKPLKVKKQSALFKKTAKKKIVPKDIAVFFRQLATMMSAGVPLVQAFEIIGRGHENEGMRDLILNRGSTQVLREASRKRGMRTLRESGLLAIFDGETTIEEVVAQTIAEEQDIMA